MERIDIHADDYGISRNSSKDILECLKQGKLQSISVLTNMSAYRESAEWLKAAWDGLPIKPQLTVHLNFMEGHCQADKEKLSLLVDEKGYFNIGWGSLFLWNYHPSRYRQVKKQLKAEIKAQTEAFLQEYGEYQKDGLRFDGHQHTQMIPIVYRALKEVVEEEKYDVSYVRVTKEPIRPYLAKGSLYKTYSPINWVKNLLLNFYAPGMERFWKKYDFQKMYLWGVVMSGRMDIERVESLLPLMKKQSEKKGRILEILFHPGSVLEKELTEEFSNTGANEFHRSEGRNIEFRAVNALKTDRKEAENSKK